MITSTPVARWTWGCDSEEGLIIRCIRDSLNAYSILHAHRLACGRPNFKISVSEAGASGSYLFRGEIPSEGGGRDEVAQRFARVIEARVDAGSIGSVDTSIRCAGMLVGEEGDYLQENLFQLGTSAFLDFVTTDLTTFSDAWMAYDLKGNPQPSVYAKNSPRLASALRDFSVVLDSDTGPEDPTYFGKPTETGVESHFEDDGAPSDSWGRFEIPYRNRIFRHTQEFEQGYRREASGRVLYFPARSRSGVLGYLWASNSEGAASFEPRDEADVEGYQAGLIWLERLKEAYVRGMTPEAALMVLREMPQAAEAGILVEEAPLEAREILELRQPRLS
ncbi:hypothetical protein [Streptomyces sp. NPDC092952]|uniref:hypothetical protein n=1 Tax=Streptomyces sp. NPDC092952 TaxID=3366018 RepID=UPI00380BA4CD